MALPWRSPTSRTATPCGRNHRLRYCRVRASSGFPPGAQRSFHGRLHLTCLLLCRRRIDLGDPAQAVGLGVMRARDEGTADLGRVPAGLDTETQRFFDLDVTRREILHQALSVCRSIWFERAG